MNEQQYERIARWLDGEDVELSASQRSLADEIRREENLLGAKLDVPAADGAVGRLRRRIMAERAQPRRRILRIGRMIGASVAAAAVLALAVTLWHSAPRAVQPGEMDQAGDVPVETLIAVMDEQTANDGEENSLDQMLDELEAEIAGMLESPAPDYQIKATRGEIDEIIWNGSSAGQSES